ncbi:MAG: dihydropteroate synthase [Promethearchaeota archaeon]
MEKNPYTIESSYMIVNMVVIQQSLGSSQLVIGDQYPVQLMGIINLSPESFFKESYISPETLLAQIKTDLDNGASILDFGARSTAPWSEPISLEEEYHRVEEALKLGLSHIPKQVLVSIDTQYADVARLALKMVKKYDLDLLINDISSFQTDPAMRDVVLESSAPVCLMATKEKPGDRKSVEEILGALDTSIQQLLKEDYPKSKIIIDPGIGKWVGEKTYEYDLEMLHNLHDFRCFQVPILIGVSRKSFIGTVLDRKDPNDRLLGSLASTSIAVFNGAHIIRAHQITTELRDTVLMASAFRKKPQIVNTESAKQQLSICPDFHTPKAAGLYLKYLGVTDKGAQIMSQKMISKLVTIDHLTAPQALILKQEMLARNGEVALHRDVITTEHKKYEKLFTAVLMGTNLQYKKLISKLKSQDLEMHRIGESIEQLLKQDLTPKINFSKDFDTNQNTNPNTNPIGEE